MAVGALRKLVQKAMKDAGTKVPRVGDISKEITKAKKKAQTIEKKRIKKQADEGYKSSTKQTKEEKNILAKVKRLEKKKAEINKQKKAISDKDKAKKDLAAKNKKTGAKRQSQTQKGVKFRKKYEMSSSTGNKRERVIAHIDIPPNTKTGRRLVICPAGIYLQRLKKLYRDNDGRLPKNDDYIIRNVGTKTSKNAHVGQPLSDSFLRRIWYEFVKDLAADKGIEFEENYTLHSCRAYYINKRLELGIPQCMLQN